MYLVSIISQVVEKGKSLPFFPHFFIHQQKTHASCFYFLSLASPIPSTLLQRSHKT